MDSWHATFLGLRHLRREVIPDAPKRLSGVRRDHPGIGFAVVIRDAVASRSVVIDPFDVEPDVAAQVRSGKVNAAGLRAVLTRVQAANGDSAEHRAASTARTSAIGIPEAGISSGELERMLKTLFGHDQHIDGDLAKTNVRGLALTSLRSESVRRRLPEIRTDPYATCGYICPQAACGIALVPTLRFPCVRC